MIIINVIEDFNQIKLAQERHIINLINKLIERDVMKNETQIELNIEGCTTDYPSTPKLIDFLLFHLAAQQGEKKLYIKLDGLGNKLIYILFILVLEGNFFKIYEKIENENDIDIWQNIINNELNKHNIILTIDFTPEKRIYVYGA